VGEVLWAMMVHRIQLKTPGRVLPDAQDILDSFRGAQYALNPFPARNGFHPCNPHHRRRVLLSQSCVLVQKNKA